MKKLHYAWVVVGVTSLALLVGAAVRSAPGILIVPFQQEFGWSRATISFAIGVNILLYGLIGPFAAAVIERGGLRRTLLAALVLVAAGVGLTLLMRRSWQLVLLWGVIVGIGCGVPATLFGVIVAERWFAARRGLVLGLLTASGAAGPLVFLPPMAALLATFGWRMMSLCLVGVVVTLIPIVALLLRERPEDVGLGPYGETSGAAGAARPAPAGNPVMVAFRALGEGIGRRDFWLLSGSFAICGLSTNGLIATHMVPACIDHGLPAVTGASILAAMGLLNFLGVTASGWLSDRYDARILLAVYYGARGLALMYLPFAFGNSLFGLGLFTLLYGLDWFASVPPTVRLTGDAFGRDKAAIMFGWILVSHQIGGAVAAYVGGVMRDWLGTYLEAFLLVGLMCFAAALMALAIGSGRRPSIPVEAAAAAQ